MKKKLYLLLAAIGLCSNLVFSQNTGKTITEKYIELPGRVTLHYAEQGDPNGIPVILLHGITDSWHSYELIMPFMPEFVHLYAISQRGHGGSGRPHYGYQPEHFAKDVAVFMKTLGIKQAVIVGHSMGSVIAQCFAIQYPELTKAVVLAGAFADCASNAGIAELNKVVAELKKPVDKKFAAEFQQSTIMRPVPPAFFDMAVNETLKVPVRVWKSVTKELAVTNYTSQLETVTVPVLLIWGDKDLFVTETDQQVLHAMLSDSKRVVYEGTGHAVHWEEPERFANDLTSFIREIQPDEKYSIRF
jgi:non-heme chloroperoxidase